MATVMSSGTHTLSELGDSSFIQKRITSTPIFDHSHLRPSYTQHLTGITKQATILTYGNNKVWSMTEDGISLFIFTPLRKSDRDRWLRLLDFPGNSQFSSVSVYNSLRVAAVSHERY